MKLSYLGHVRFVASGFLLALQVVDKELFHAGFDLNEETLNFAPDALNATLGNNLTGPKLHTVELMGMQVGKECYAISVASALTLVAGVYQVKEWLQSHIRIQKLQFMWYI